MGAIGFSEAGVTLETGHPTFNPSTFEWTREKGNLREMPSELQKPYLAMQVQIPPEEVICSAAGQVDLHSRIAAIFGSGQSGGADIEWCPTDKVLEYQGRSVRAWLRHRRWVEGGGSGWIGQPSFHDWVIAGAYIDEEALRAWAEELYSEHSLFKLIADASLRPNRVSQDTETWLFSDSEPISWPEVEIKESGLGFIKPDFYMVEEGLTSAGVYKEFFCAYGLWQGSVRVFKPDLWRVYTRREVFSAVAFEFVEAVNGKETRRFFTPPGWNKEGDTYLATANLPKKMWTPPSSVAGKFATFWNSPAQWEQFALEHHICAEVPFLGSHGSMWWKGQGGYLVVMNADWAKEAWSHGAAMLPPTFGDVPSREEIDKLRIPNPEWGKGRIMDSGPLKGAKFFSENGRRQDVWCCLPDCFHGWIRAPHDVNVAFGCTVRAVGDDAHAEKHEVVVFEDGTTYVPARD